MKITLASLEVRNSEQKGDYAYAKGQINKKDGTVRENVTFMSFGTQFANVRDQLVVGAELDVKAVFDGGTVKILGMTEVQADQAQSA